LSKCAVLIITIAVGFACTVLHSCFQLLHWPWCLPTPPSQFLDHRDGQGDGWPPGAPLPLVVNDCRALSSSLKLGAGVWPSKEQAVSEPIMLWCQCVFFLFFFPVAFHMVLLSCG
jgi:hypothetical protein